MSAAVLREAAALMRERAAAATAVSSPEWWAQGVWYHHYPVLDGEPGEVDAIPWPAVGHGSTGAGVVGHFAAQDAADHAASWHPGVALAVADLLLYEANKSEFLEECGSRGHDADSWCVKVAAAFLGRQP